MTSKPTDFEPETDSEDELAPGWEERVTLDGQVFYANHITKTTQWTHPRTGNRKTVSGSLPFGWEREIIDDKVIYVDHINKRTTFTDPRLAFATEDRSSKKGQEFRQRFDASSSALQVLHNQDLSGKTVVVTGASLGGIGFETARTIALQGAHVVLACKTMDEATEACMTVLEERSNCKVFPKHLDLRSLRSVNDFMKEITNDFPRLDVLILNAAVFGLPFQMTVDNLEETFQVNYLSQVYLAFLLRDMMSKSLKPRLIYVSCESHRFSDLSKRSAANCLNAMHWKDGFNSLMAYNNSKLLGMMFSIQANEEWYKFGIRSFSAHPGNMVSSKLSRNWWLYRILFAVVRPFSKSLQQAASSVVFAAFASELEDMWGVYINNCIPTDPSDKVKDPKTRRAFWELTFEILREKLKGIDEESRKKMNFV